MKLQQGFEWNCDLTVCLEREKGVEVSVKVWERCVGLMEGIGFIARISLLTTNCSIC